jgi:spermidine synthase
LLFLPSSLVFGTVPPIITKLKLKDMSTVGKTSGIIHSMSTLGGIFGTFLGGFFLVPYFGCRSILFVIAAVTALTVLLIGGKKKIKYVTLVFMVAAICIYVFSQHNSDSADAILAGDENYIAAYDTQYSRVEIMNGEENGDKVRYMIIGNGCESATYVDEAKKYELVVPYTRYYDLMFSAGIDIHDVLMIGGGGYSYPKYCMSHHAETNIDVVEIDEKITELAKKYFYLDDALAEFNTKERERLNLINDDGKAYINKSDKKYDAVLNDAFTGTTPVKSLATIETVRQIRDMLNPGGVYLSNIIGSHKGDGTGFLMAEVKTISQVFKYVYVVPCVDADAEWDEETVINNMVVASDHPLAVKGAVVIDCSAGLILTDDYCPVDTLIPEEE